MNPDVAVSQLASIQHGVFHRQQAIARGFSAWMVRHRVESERWIRLHPSVYCLNGVAASWKRDQMAACLWSNSPTAGVGAGHLFDLPGCENPPLEVLTTPSHRAMARCGIVVHLTKRLPHEQITTRHRIPCTTVERTLMDLCAQFDQRRAAIAVDMLCFEDSPHWARSTIAFTSRQGEDEMAVGGCGPISRRG